MDINKLYKSRFKFTNELEKKNRIWKILCEKFFNNFIPFDSTVIDIGSGYCEFINNIKCKKKLALDLNEDIKRFSNEDVLIINDHSSVISSLDDSSIDIVFISNFLEHLANKIEVYNTLKECRRILKKNGRIIILQPNIRYAYKNYWDFFDHNVPLSDKSLVEVLNSIGMRVLLNLPRFLPFSTKSRFPKNSLFIILYLKMPFVWKIFGKQALIISEKE